MQHSLPTNTPTNREVNKTTTNTNNQNQISTKNNQPKYTKNCLIPTPNIKSNTKHAQTSNPKTQKYNQTQTK